MASSSPVPEQQTSPVVPPRRAHPLHGVLVGLLAAVVVLALAVVALAVIVWNRTAPAVPPTGPDVNVVAKVTVTGAKANASLQLAGTTDSVAVDQDVKSWAETVRFGETIQLTVVLTTQYQNDAIVDPGSATCSVADARGNSLRAAKVSVLNGVAQCSWTNDGKG